MREQKLPTHEETLAAKAGLAQHEQEFDAFCRAAPRPILATPQTHPKAFAPRRSPRTGKVYVDRLPMPEMEKADPELAQALKEHQAALDRHAKERRERRLALEEHRQRVRLIDFGDTMRQQLELEDMKRLMHRQMAQKRRAEALLRSRGVKRNDTPEYAAQLDAARSEIGEAEVASDEMPPSLRAS